MKTAIIFEQFGPYHHARVAALQRASDQPVVPAQMAALTSVYNWKNEVPVECAGLVTLCAGKAESLSPLRLFFAARRFFIEHGVETALLPSYAPATSMAVLLAAISCGVRRVMMNESHAGTERVSAWKRNLKRWLVSRFDAALVGGLPQKRHFTNLGMDPAKIFLGYDAIDNDFFVRESDRVWQDPDGWRCRLGLPARYILSLGRMVKKKNLGCLLDAYASLCQRLGPDAPTLVLVGSGDQEPSLRDHCANLDINVINSLVPNQEILLTGRERAVVFCGFRQINENPIFYALAECFVLPSLWEEWGLVVNEAMACGLPIIVSTTVGCAEDLVLHGENGFHFVPTRAHELTDALHAIATNPVLRESMGKKSRDIIADWGCQNFAANALAAIRSLN